MNKFFEDRLINFWQSLLSQRDYFFIVDIVIVALIIYFVLNFLRQIKATRVLYTVVAVVFVYFLAKGLGLQTVNFLMPAILILLIVSLPVLFQNELRAIWMKGAISEVVESRLADMPPSANFYNELIESVRELSKQAVDATLIITRQKSNHLSKDAVYLDAQLSSQLITTLLHNDSPLNRDAFLISGNRIIAANLSVKDKDGHKIDFSQISKEEAMEVNRQYGSIMIIIAPKSGEVTLVQSEQINEDIDASTLKQALVKYYSKDKNV